MVGDPQFALMQYFVDLLWLLAVQDRRVQVGELLFEPTELVRKFIQQYRWATLSALQPLVLIEKMRAKILAQRGQGFGTNLRTDRLILRLLQSYDVTQKTKMIHVVDNIGEHHYCSTPGLNLLITSVASLLQRRCHADRTQDQLVARGGLPDFADVGR
jgi:hypothetical protein